MGPDNEEGRAKKEEEGAPGAEERREKMKERSSKTRRGHGKAKVSQRSERGLDRGGRRWLWGWSEISAGRRISIRAERAEGRLPAPAPPSIGWAHPDTAPGEQQKSGVV
jgi:hypothetical protein